MGQKAGLAIAWMALALPAAVASVEPQSGTFVTQESGDPPPFRSPNVAQNGCSFPLNPMDIMWVEPAGGVTESTGLMIYLTGLARDCERPRAMVMPDAAWPDQKNVVIARVYWRNMPFFPPMDMGKFAMIDALRGLGFMLDHYPQIDRRRLYLYGESGGGHLALQTLAASRGLWAEVHVHSSITRLSLPKDMNEAGYESDPKGGWNGNLSWPAEPGAEIEKWRRIVAERTLRSPQFMAEFDPIASFGTESPELPEIWAFHGSKDNMVDTQHFLDLRAALERGTNRATQPAGPSQTQLANWHFVTIENGAHGYQGAAADENSRVAADKKHVPESFLRQLPAEPDLRIDYISPAAEGYRWRVRGTSPASVSIETILPTDQASSGGWELVSRV